MPSFDVVSKTDLAEVDNAGSFEVLEGNYYESGLLPMQHNATVLIEHNWKKV